MLSIEQLMELPEVKREIHEAHVIATIHFEAITEKEIYNELREMFIAIREDEANKIIRPMFSGGLDAPYTAHILQLYKSLQRPY